MRSDDAWRNSSGLYGGVKQRTELAGMINGILADSVINIAEIAHLATWVREQGGALGSRFVPVLEELDDVLADGRIDAEEEQRLRTSLYEALRLCDASSSPDDADEFTWQLIGILKGVTADQTLNNLEIAHLQELLASPGAEESAIAAAIRRVMEQYGEDPGQLWRTMCAIAGHSPEDGITGGLAIGGIFDDPAEPSDIDFHGTSFCFTGTFSFGSRTRCAERVIGLGGDFHKNPKRSTDFLVIGTMETRAWAGPNYGRKIEAALEARDAGAGPLIISETAWEEAARSVESGRAKIIDIDPDEYFAGWTYRPNRAQRPALSIKIRERIDVEQTRIAREKAKQEGKPKQEINAIRITRYSWTIKQPMEHDFHVGDLFWEADGTRWVQVAHDGEPLEVHSNQSGTSRPYHVTETGLTRWLRTGVEPVAGRIDPYQCRSEIHKFLLAAEMRKQEKEEAQSVSEDE